MKQFIFCLLLTLVVAPAFAQSWVTEVIPAQNARVNGTQPRQIEVRFSEDLDGTSLDDQSIRVYGDKTGRYQIHNITYDSVNRLLQFTTVKQLMVGETITISLTQDIRNVTLQPMSSAFVWQFQVNFAGGLGVFDRKIGWNVSSRFRFRTADFDQDRNLDMVSGVDFRTTSDIKFYANNGDGHITLTQIISLPDSRFATGDFDADFDMDLISGGQYNGSDNTSHLSNDGSGYFSNSLLFDIAMASRIVQDFNGDGFQDLFAAVENGMVRAYLNDGSGGFTLHAELLMGGPDRRSFIPADWDNDGDIDILVILDFFPSTEDKLIYLINDGNANFHYQSSIPFNTPGGAAIGDFDNDSDLDLIVVTYQRGTSFPEPQLLQTYLNNGSGGLIPHQKIDFDKAGLIVRTLDIDNDNDIDFLLSLPHRYPSRLGFYPYLNDGNGFFVYSDSFVVPYIDDWQIADFDGDQDADLLTFGVDNLALWENLNMQQTVGLVDSSVQYTPVKISQTLEQRFRIVNKGSQDLVISSVVAQAPELQVSPTTAVIPFGDTLTVTVAFTPSDPSPFESAIIVTSNDPQYPSVNIPVFGLGSHVLTVQPAQNNFFPPDGNTVRVQFTTDMDTSLLLPEKLLLTGSKGGNYPVQQVDYHAATRTATFHTTGQFIPGDEISATLSDSLKTSAGIIERQGYSWRFNISTTGGSLGFQPQPSIEVPNTISMLMSGDFTGDQIADIAYTLDGKNTISILQNDGSGGFALAQTLLAPVKINGAGSWDIDQDGDLDFLTVTVADSSLSIFRNDGAGIFSLVKVSDFSNYGRKIRFADFNNDGHTDLAVEGANIAIFLHDGSLNFSLGEELFDYSKIGKVPESEGGFQVGDLDNDGRFDIVYFAWLARSGVQTLLLRNGENDRFLEKTTIPPRFNFWGRNYLKLIDLDNDSGLDLFWVEERQNSFDFLEEAKLLVNNESWHFTQDIFFPDSALHRPRAVADGDFDADGDIDLAIAMEAEAGAVRYFANDGLGNFSHMHTTPLIGQPSLTTTADFDQDGSLDIAIATTAPDKINVYLNGGVTNVNSPTDDQLPVSYHLAQNYPNPFNPTTTIEFQLPVASQVTLEIFDILGRLVQTRYSASQPAGTHQYAWDATDDSGNPVASGVYFYRLSAGDFQQVRKMLLVR